MGVVFTLQGIVTFAYVLGILVTFSHLDIRARRVPNKVIGITIIASTILGILTGHILAYLLLHLIAVILMICVATVLFKLDAIGGADAKTLVVIAWTSPGMEFATYDNLVFEALIGGLVPLLIMFILGYLYSKKSVTTDSRPTPLIPFLLAGFLLMQVLALIQ